MTERAPGRLAAGAALVLVVGATLAATGADAASSPATFSIRVGANGRGTFAVTGAVADTGRALVRRAVVGGRLVATATLTGAKGGMTLTSRQPCRGGAGTWRVVSGTRAYEKVRGWGVATGRASCTRPLGAVTITYRGTLELPPPALAAPGSWGGATSDGSVLFFEVTPDGRAISGVVLGPYRYECVRSDGLRSPASTGVDSRYPGPFPIGEDRSFSFKAGTATIAGRFEGATATGTLSVSYTLPADANGRTSTCSGSLGWSAATPAPPAKRALVGTYCGFAAAGEGACVDVPDGGRTVRNFRIGVVVPCGDTVFTFRIEYDTTLPLASDLSFRASYTQRLFDGSAQAFLSGTFDQAGGMQGRLTLQQPSFTHEGVRRACRNGGASFTATLQR